MAEDAAGASLDDDTGVPPGDAAEEAGRVALGFDAAFGFAEGDQTSPSRAGAMHALLDVSLTEQPVTELRIHGVSGSNGPTMLEHPTVLQVGGDSVAGFFRRWSPGGSLGASVPWKLEAYSWGGMTEKPLASASWLLLSPFMMYNVAHFMLPPQPPPSRGSGERPAAGHGEGPRPRTAGHWIAHVLLRLLALAATVQLVSGTATLMISTVAWQVGRKSLLPSWMGWYADLAVGWRMAIAVLGVAAVIGVLWWVSVTTASHYEARTTTVVPDPGSRWPLTDAGFWRGEKLVSRQRSLHVAAAFAAAALIVALPAERLAVARWSAVGLAAAVLAVAAGMLIAPVADRNTLMRGVPSAGRQEGLGGWSCRAVLAFAVAAVVLSAAVAGLGDQRHGSRPGPLPGLTGFTLALLVTQLALLLALTVTVAVLAGRGRPQAGRDGSVPRGREFRPYLGGGLAALFAVLAFCLGGLLTAVVNLGVARLLGSPLPGGFQFRPALRNGIAVPWPVYAAGAGALGLVAGTVLAAIVGGRAYLRIRRRFWAGTTGAISIASAYKDRGGKTAGTKSQRKVASAWAIGELADGAAVLALLVVGGWLAAMVLAEIVAYRFAGTTGKPHILTGSGWLHGTVSLIAVAGTLVAGYLVVLLRSAYSSVSDRKAVGALWDVATFWPRAVHPLAPPCYAERAVPEVVDRIRLITGAAQLGPDDPMRLLHEAELPDLVFSPGLTVPAGPVLLTGYSQGTTIAVAVIAQVPKLVRDHVALLTLACPARRLYGRAFPAYFGPEQLDEMNCLLDGADRAGERGEAGYRWRNLVRRSDYIGSWVFCDPLEHVADENYSRDRWLRENVDQPCWDPVILAHDEDPTPPPIHRHFGWWQDPRSGEMGALLVDRLKSTMPEPG